jgi:hypothetical protein
MPTIARLPVDTAFVAMLRAQLSQNVYFADSATAESGLPPPDATLPYVVVYDIPGGEYSGPPWADPEGIAEFYFQTTCVGGTASQANWMADFVRTLVVGRTATGDFTTALTVTGASVMDRYSLDGTSAADATGSLYQSTPRFCIIITN